MGAFNAAVTRADTGGMAALWAQTERCAHRECADLLCGSIAAVNLAFYLGVAQFRALPALLVSHRCL